MKKNTIYKFSLILMQFLLLSQNELIAQITINNTSNTVNQLVNGVLVPSGSGTTISNVVFRGVYNNSNRYQVGHFSSAGNTLSQMGFTSGVVITSGNTSTIPLTLGTNPGSVAQMGTAYLSGTPGELRQTGSPPPTIIQDLDVLAGAFNYFNGAILEFDFVPVNTKVQFRYVFGSEEYSDQGGAINYQCSSYNDKFGFLISGPGITGGQGFSNNAKNIARLANGSEVSINSVNNGIVGSSASSQNATYCTAANGDWTQNTPTPEFGLNNGHIDGTQLNGNTKILTASQSGLIPGQTYHIKLMVTDVNDATYDSVVYLEAGSFTTAENCSAGANQTLCSTTSTTLAATSPLTGTWSVTSGTAIFSNSNSPTSGVTGLSNGINVLRWTAIDLSCYAEVTITVNDTAPKPILSTLAPTCSSTGITTILNYDSANTYAFNPVGPSIGPTGIVNGATIGTSYTITSSNTFCTSLPSNTFTNDAQLATPLAPIVVSPVIYCQNATASALTALGSNLIWYTAATGGVGSTSAPTPSTSVAGSSNYYVSQTLLGCEGPRAAITVTISDTPVAPTVVTPVTYCQNATASALFATGSNLLWYTTETGGIGSASAPTPSTSVAGSTNYYVSQTLLGCEGPRAAITVTINDTPNPLIINTITQPTCNVATGSVTLSGLPTSGTCTVTATPGGATISNSGTTAVFSGLAPNTYTFTVTNSNGCTSAASGSATILAQPITPSAPIVGTISQPTCSTATGSVTLSGLPASGTWTVTANPGGVTISNSGTTAVFSGLAPNTYTFTVTNSNGCTSAASGSATILAQPTLPAPPSGSSNQSFCENGNPTIGDLTVSGTSIHWYDSLVGGNLLPTTKPLENGVTYYASQMIGNCESNRLTITVTITQLPNIVITSGCEGTDYVATATTTTQNASGLVYEWYSASNLNIIIGSNPSIIIPIKGDYVLKVLLNGCFKQYPISIESLYCDIPKGISPNGDDKNEFFDLSNLNVKKIEIFNRYGMKVYSHLNYKKEWDGRTDNGQELPDGTYYYLIEFENRKSKTGWVYLSR